jgi:hypothetical protein
MTKTDRAMEDAMLAAAGDTERVEVISKARAFKRTWIELAEALTRVYDRESWTRWGYDSFEVYCRKELHIKKGTVHKLLGSYRFMAARAPKVIERSRRDMPGDAPEPVATPMIPSLQAVDFVARAAERGAADGETMREMERAVFEEGAEAPLLSRRFKQVAFPVDAKEKREKLRGQLGNSARRLASLIAEPDAPVPHEVAIAVEEAIGQLLDALDAA